MTIGLTHLIVLIGFAAFVGFSYKFGYSIGTAVGDIILEKYLDWKRTWRKYAKNEQQRQD